MFSINFPYSPLCTAPKLQAVAAIVVSLTIVVLCCNIIHEIIAAAHSILRLGGDAQSTHCDDNEAADDSGSNSSTNMRELDVDSSAEFLEVEKSSSSSVNK